MDSQQSIPVTVMGHVTISDITDNVPKILVDKDNAVHPANMARIISRALSRESNYFIHKMAFGNGGTIVDAAYQITYKTPNDGQAPDTSEWKSRLYNETYYEIVDDSNINIGVGPGSSHTNDPVSSTSSGPGVRSEELGLISKVTIEVILNPFEPSGQSATDLLFPTEGTEDAFVFDELGLFTAGSPLTPTPGYQDVDVSEKYDTDSTGLTPTTVYTFTVTVNGGTPRVVSFNTGVGSGVGGDILYSDLLSILNSDPNLAGAAGCTVRISNATGTVNTFGRLQFMSNNSGLASSVVIDSTVMPANWLFSNLSGYVGLGDSMQGQDAGVRNDPTNPANEGERMLTHLIFSPVRKSANRTIKVVYTLTVQVARSFA